MTLNHSSLREAEPFHPTFLGSRLRPLGDVKVRGESQTEACHKDAKAFQGEEESKNFVSQGFVRDTLGLEYEGPMAGQLPIHPTEQGQKTDILGSIRLNVCRCLEKNHHIDCNQQFYVLATESMRCELVLSRATAEKIFSSFQAGAGQQYRRVLPRENKGT